MSAAEMDIEILELLASKICHDLISPVGAIANGVELLEELGGGDEDVTSLISFSAGQASSLLQLFRIAYGAGGADSSIKPEDVYNAIEKLISTEEKIRQDWDPHAPLSPEDLPKGLCKILTACLLLTIDSLPRGGTLSVDQEEGEQIAVTATGQDAHFKEGVCEALSPGASPHKLDPKSIHAYIINLMAKNYGFAVNARETGGGSIILKIKLPTPI